MQIANSTVISARFSFQQNEKSIDANTELLNEEKKVIEADMKDFPSLKNIASFRSLSRMLEIHQAVESLQKQNIITLLNLLAETGVNITAGTVEGEKQVEVATPKEKKPVSRGGHSRFKKSPDALDDEEDYDEDDEEGELDDPLKE